MSEEWQSSLWDRINLDRETGKLTWRAKAPISNENRRWNSRYAGKPAIAARSERGYLSGRFCGRSVLAHRVVWFLVHAEWPNTEIDHINGIKDDNRPENLRAVSRSENCRNAAIYKNNTSGVAGVNKTKEGRWIARIGAGAERRNLGVFETLECAAEARRKAEKELQYSSRHGKNLPAPTSPKVDA